MPNQHSSTFAQLSQWQVYAISKTWALPP
jgi:hypothetical protein